jgi:PKD repeat protein
MDSVRKLIFRLGFALAMAVSSLGSAQAAITQDWAVIDYGKFGAMLAVDKSNSTYVAGSGGISSTIVLSKFSPTGAKLWERAFDSPLTRQQANWVTLDSLGNAIVVGMFVSSSTNGPTGGLVVLKYDPAGNLLWQDTIPSNFGYAWRAATDSAGNVFVLGSRGTGLGSDLTTIKYSPSGVPLWARSYLATPTSLHGPASMVVTPTGNVIVTGGNQSTMDAVAYDTNGNQIWAKSISPATSANDVALGPQGEIYLVGGDTTPAAMKGMLVVKHDANFNELWRKTYAVGYDASRAGVDSLGNLVATGVTLGEGSWMTIKLDPNGTMMWSRATDRSAFIAESPNGLTIGPDNSVYVTGQAGFSLNGNTYLGATTEKFAPDGTLVWSTQAQAPSRGLGIKLGSDGSVFVVGNGPWGLLHYTQDGAGTALPTAAASASTVLGPEPLSVNFSSAGSTGALVSTFWNFGDFSSSVEANPTHVFAAGTYTVTLKVTDNVGGSATSAPITITVNPASPPPPAPVSMHFSRTKVKGGTPVNATVALSFPVPAPTAMTLQLSSSAPRVASVPATVLVPAGAASATFTIRTADVRRTTVVAVTASTVEANVVGTFTIVKD